MIGIYNRDVSIRKARRKRRIDQQHKTSWNNGEPVAWYDNLHQYSKNKIHTANIRGRTRNKGSRRIKYGNYDRSIHYSAADMRKVLAMDEDMREAGYHAPRHKRGRFAQ